MKLNNFLTSLPRPKFLMLLLLAAGGDLAAQETSSLVNVAADQTLEYAGYANRDQSQQDNLLIDFSSAGYMGGGVAIPWVPIERVIEPSVGDGDDYAAIQSAIDQVSSLPQSTSGFRGTVLLKAGTFHVSQTLNIGASGVVIRGEGQGEDGTVIRYTATTQSNLFEFRGSGDWTEIPGTDSLVSDTFIPCGVRSFNVVTSNAYAVGDRLMIERTPNQAWIDQLGTGDYGWTPEAYVSWAPRRITAIEGNLISVDAPTVNPIEQQYGGARVYRYHHDGALCQVGIENIRLESTFASSTDENHGWRAILFWQVENGWARQVTARHFGYSCVEIRQSCQHITVEDCAQLDPKSIVTGGRRYSFVIDDSSHILVQRCYTRSGRHDFVTQSKTVGPIAFVDCLAEDARNDSGPHHRYSEGILFDNIQVDKLNVQNRRSSGTGHGWAGAQTVFWNCVAATMICDAPPAAMNFSIGCIASQRQGQWQPSEPDGFWESRNQHVAPRSLYYRQLRDRLGHQALDTITSKAQTNGPIWSQLATWQGDSSVDWLPSFAPIGLEVKDDFTVNLTEESVLSGVIRYPLPDNFAPPSATWSQISGPAAAVIAAPTSLSSPVSFVTPGVYQFQLSAVQIDDRDPQSPVIYSNSKTLTIEVIAPTSSPSLLAAFTTVDSIVGRSQSNGPGLVYLEDTNDNTVGVTGSWIDSSRHDRNLVFGFTLPNLSTNEILTGAALNFNISSYRNHSGADPDLDVYLLLDDNPAQTGIDFFFHGANDPSPAVLKLGTVSLSAPQGGQMNFSPTINVRLNFDQAAFDVLQALYSSNGAPAQPELFFRFNLSNLIVGSGESDIGSSVLDRYALDLNTDQASLELFIEAVEAAPIEPTITIDLSSRDAIVGRSQTNGPGLIYIENTSENMIGVTGSSADSSRHDQNLVFGFDLPDLPANYDLADAQLSFQIPAFRDHSSHSPALHVYFLNASSPATTGAQFFFHGTDDPNPATQFVGEVALTSPDRSEQNYAPPLDIQIPLPQAILEEIKNFYADGNHPSQERVFFRFNLDNLVIGSGDASLNGFTLDRYRLGLQPEQASLTLNIQPVIDPLVTAELTSFDAIIGRAQDNGPDLGYVENTSEDTVGITGSTALLTRHDQNLVMGFALPDLPSGYKFSALDLNFEITAFRNHSGESPALHVYLLDLPNPATTGAQLFFHGADDPNPATSYLGAIDLDAMPGAEVGYTPPVSHTLSLPSSAIAKIEALYSGGSTPSQTEIFFRFNLSNLIVGSGNADLHGYNLDRYRLGSDSEQATLLMHIEPLSLSAEPAEPVLSQTSTPEDYQTLSLSLIEQEPTALTSPWLGLRSGGEPNQGSQQKKTAMPNLRLIDATQNSIRFNLAKPTGETAIAKSHNLIYQWSLDLKTWYRADGQDGPGDGTTLTINFDYQEEQTTGHAQLNRPCPQAFIRIISNPN